MADRFMKAKSLYSYSTGPLLSKGILEPGLQKDTGCFLPMMNSAIKIFLVCAWGQWNESMCSYGLVIVIRHTLQS